MWREKIETNQGRSGLLRKGNDARANSVQSRGRSERSMMVDDNISLLENKYNMRPEPKLASAPRRDVMPSSPFENPPVRQPKREEIEPPKPPPREERKVELKEEKKEEDPAPIDPKLEVKEEPYLGEEEDEEEELDEEALKRTSFEKAGVGKGAKAPEPRKVETKIVPERKIEVELSLDAAEEKSHSSLDEFDLSDQDDEEIPENQYETTLYGLYDKDVTRSKSKWTVSLVNALLQIDRNEIMMTTLKCELDFMKKDMK
eukprot:TRINITY_DN1902_c0_g1_i14.p1 TRINITY_DN1902_c0_g1~~TRINITY_DN1902_c0_g1_i14.p1  ORF type:complete len:259 (-),score=81.06 TRINITY_DN1902_c0_g1_i14:124-900(-)